MIFDHYCSICCRASGRGFLSENCPEGIIIVKCKVQTPIYREKCHMKTTATKYLIHPLQLNVLFEQKCILSMLRNLEQGSAILGWVNNIWCKSCKL